MSGNDVYLNGQYLPLTEAKISVLDRGFLFGDGVYEVIPVYTGHLFRFQEHLKRLNDSLHKTRLPNPYDHQQWLNILTPLLTDTPEQSIYLQITRGVAQKRDHAFPEETQPTVFAMCSPIKHSADRENGAKAITLDDTRWDLCNIKATTLLANILLRQQAVEQGCAEAILVKDGVVTEGAASNIFAVVDDILLTPPKNREILPGITRDVILELAEKQRIPYAEQRISQEALKSASEIWLTSSTREIIPVVELDGELISDGKPGPVWHKMNRFFQDYKYSAS